MVKVSCGSDLWEVYIGVLGRGEARIGPSPLLKLNKSPTDHQICILRQILYLSCLHAGLPTLTAVICGISGVYGKYSLKLMTENNHSSTAEM